MNREIKSLIIQRLHELPVCLTNEDNTEHTIRCPYCGDSKDPTHGHLGIYINDTQDDAMLWHCFRCGEGGAVTDDFLSDVGVLLSEGDVSELRLYTKKLAKLTRRGIIKTERFTVPVCPDTPLNREKLAYINGRLGCQLNLETAARYKILPSLAAFMTHNEIQQFDNHVPPYMYKYLERDYVGFLSSNNNLLTFRNIREGGKGKRYYKITINPFNVDHATFYSIPTQLSLFYEGDLHVHVAEGTFDILGIHFNTQPQGENRILYASCGYNYLGLLKHLARRGLCTHLNLHVYADADKSDKDHLDLLHSNAICAFIEHLYLHRNTSPNQKDYGVTADLIQDRYRKVW